MIKTANVTIVTTSRNVLAAVGVGVGGRIGKNGKILRYFRDRGRHYSLHLINIT